jgi:hypothetical protein
MPVRALVQCLRAASLIAAIVAEHLTRDESVRDRVDVRDRLTARLARPQMFVHDRVVR